MPVNQTDTYQLVGKIEQRKRPLPYYLQRYYPSIIESQTEEIHFDEVVTERKMAPFVSPLVAGKVMAGRGHTMKSFRPAYVKPKHVLRPSKALKRRAGEPFGGNMSPAARMELIKAETFVDQSEMIDNRLEWMAAEVAKTGKLVIAGENYPSQEVDYGRDAGLAVTLLTTARWNDSAPTMVDDIEDMITAMANADFGAPGDSVYMEPNVWKLLRKDQEFIDLTDKNFAGNNSSADRAAMAFDENEEPQLVATMGGGRISFYVDSRKYTNDSGVVTPYLGAGEVIFMSSQIRGSQAFGAILDDDVLQPMRAYPKSWKQEDPSVRYAMTQSAPLVIPERINGTAYLKVF